MPSDRLAGVLSHAQNDFQRFVMVLVCVHALSGTDIRHLLLTNLDLSRERLVVRHPGERHIIYLDELTYRCASAWLRERHRRWPVTTNPHLLINRWTAVDTTHSPIGTTFTAIFRPTGLTMPTLRQDRIRERRSRSTTRFTLCACSVSPLRPQCGTSLRLTPSGPRSFPDEASGSHRSVHRGPGIQ
ncbi:hypothetical protein [Streptomyces sp. NPDC057545]|uniref:hypothetical protein n=1 Tax=unclassified Streptomyces TaxID=2593676 RepID=UPI00367AA312